MNKALMKDLRNGMGLEEALIKHKTNLKEVMGVTPTQKRLPEKYIYRVKGVYVISKQVNGKLTHFGTYDFLSEAKTVRRELIKHNWNKLKLGKILNDNNISFSIPTKSPNKNKYITRLVSGNYFVEKKFRSGRHTVRVKGGTYKKLEDARIIRDELIQCDWNETLLPEIKQKHGIVNSLGE